MTKIYLSESNKIYRLYACPACLQRRNVVKYIRYLLKGLKRMDFRHEAAALIAKAADMDINEIENFMEVPAKSEMGDYGKDNEKGAQYDSCRNMRQNRRRRNVL